MLVPLFRDGHGDTRLVLVARGEAGIHGGQVGLPGGKHEPADSSLLETALRETQEEIGLTRSDVEILAALDSIDARTTGFRVHPFLARIRPVKWHLAAGEISAVLTPTVETLTDPRRRTNTVLTFPGWPKPRAVERVELNGEHAVWGLTLRLLDLVAPRLLAGEWDV